MRDAFQGLTTRGRSFVAAGIAVLVAAAASAAEDLLRIAVLLSGSGTSLENLFEHIERGELDARVSVVIASRPGAGGLERARRRGVPAFAVARKEHPDVGEFNDRLHAILAEHEVDVVALLGFLSPFAPRERYRTCTLNVHPALIPACSGRGYYGHHVHEAVLESGVKVSGATVHFADDEYDHGPIVLQEAVAVRDDDTPDTLAARVQAAGRVIRTPSDRGVVCLIDDRFARKAIEKGADGLIAVAAGAGGHAGRWSPFALIHEIRRWFDGPLALSGAIATGEAVLAAADASLAEFEALGYSFTDRGRRTDEILDRVQNAGMPGEVQ